MANRKGSITLTILLGLILALIVVYILLYLPIPAFTKLRMFVNYFLIIILWIIVQAGLIFAYVTLGKNIFRWASIFRRKLVKWQVNFKRKIMGF